MQNFLLKVNKNSGIFGEDGKYLTQCWTWTGKLMKNGYAIYSTMGKSILVHRFSYKYFCGPIPKNKVIDHLCRVRHCVNPDHLEVTTQQVNILRGTGASAQNARKIYCDKGHLLNNNVTKWSKKQGRRVCSICNTLWRRNKYGYVGPKTHCPLGHQYVQDNIYYRPDKKGIECLICRRQKAKNFQSKKKLSP